MTLSNIDYSAVLADLQTRKAQIEAAILGIKAMLATGSTNGASPQAGGKSQSSVQGTARAEPTNADRAAAALREAGRPLHLSQLRERVAAAGKDINEGVLRDVMTRKDKIGRFTAYGKGIFGLNEENDARHARTT